MKLYKTAKNLKIACIKNNIKIYELAIKLDLTPDYLSKVIMGISVFCKSKFLTFAKIFPQAPVGNFYRPIYLNIT